MLLRVCEASRKRLASAKVEEGVDLATKRSNLSVYDFLVFYFFMLPACLLLLLLLLVSVVSQLWLFNFVCHSTIEQWLNS